MAGVQSQLLGIGIWVSVALVAWRSRRLSHDPFQGVVALSLFVGVTLVGARLGAVSVGSLPWRDFLNPDVAGMTSSGGAIAGALLALFLVSGGAGGRRLLDDLTPGMWLLVAVSRLGCVLQGCDFGRPTFWGIAYQAPSAAWSTQLLGGRISSEATVSLATFPFPLLDGVAALVALAVAWRPSRRPAMSTLWSALAYLSIRFCLEFGRDPATTEFWGVFTRPQVLLGVVGYGCYLGLRVLYGASNDTVSP